MKTKRKGKNLFRKCKFLEDNTYYSSLKTNLGTFHFYVTLNDDIWKISSIVFTDENGSDTELRPQKYYSDNIKDVYCSCLDCSSTYIIQKFMKPFEKVIQKIDNKYV